MHEHKHSAGQLRPHADGSAAMRRSMGGEVRVLHSDRRVGCASRFVPIPCNAHPPSLALRRWPKDEVPRRPLRNSIAAGRPPRDPGLRRDASRPEFR